MSTTTSHGSNTNKRTIKSIKPDEVIQVMSEEQAVKLCKALGAAGFKWNDGYSYKTRTNYNYADQNGAQYYNILEGTTSGSKHVIDCKYKIVLFDDLDLDEPLELHGPFANTLEDIKAQSEKAIIIFTKVLALQAELSELPLFADIKLTIQTHGTKD